MFKETRPAGTWCLSVLFFCLLACGESNFQPQAVAIENKPVAKAEPAAKVVPAVDTLVSEPEKVAEEPTSASVEPVTPPAPPAPAPPPPPGAIVKGSFTVYSIPPYPRQDQDYEVFVKVVLLPGQGVNYERRDLTIQVRGTDGYTANFPQGLSTGGASSFKVTGDTVLASLKIPGAANNVKDTVACSSVILNEKQQIELVFGAQPK